MAKTKEKKVAAETKFNSYSFVYGEGLDLPEDEQKRLVDKYAQLVSDSLAARKDKENEWDLDAMILSNQRPPKTKPWIGCSNVALGFAAEMRDTISETIVARENGSDRTYNLIGQDDFSQDHEEEVEAWINYVVRTAEEFKTSDTFVRAFATDDTAIMAVGMEREVITVKQWVKAKDILNDQSMNVLQKAVEVAKNMFGDYKIKEKQVVNIKHKVNVLRKEDVIVPANARDNFETMHFCGYFYYPTLDEVKAKNSGGVEYYKNVDLLKGKENKQEEKNDVKKTETDTKIGAKNTVPELQLVVLHVKEDINKTGTLEPLILIFEYKTKIFLRAQYNQYFHGKRNLLAASALPDRDNFWGISVPSVIRPLQLEAEATFNQTSDNWDLTVKKIFTKIKTAKITVGSEDGDDNEIYPGSIVEIASPNDLQVLNVGSVDYNSLPLINHLEQWISKRAGFSTTGGGDPSDPRASGKKLGLIMSQGSIRVDAMFKRYNNMKEEYVKMLISLYAQYGDEKLTYRAWDEESKDYVLKQMDREVLQKCKFAVFMNGLQFSTSREEEKQEELWFYETVLKSPIITMPPAQLSQFAPAQLESLMEITKGLFSKYGKSDKARYLPSTDKIKQSIEAEITLKLEAQMKQILKQILAMPKATPADIAKAQAMADNVAKNGLGAMPAPVAPEAAPVQNQGAINGGQ